MAVINWQLVRRLIETDEMPIREISEHSRHDQNVRRGHLHNLHVWWATRPLAACRAVLLATLLPDPEDPECPESFRITASQVLPDIVKRIAGGRTRNPKRRGSTPPTPSVDLSLTDPKVLRDDPKALRRALFAFIGTFAEWELSIDPQFVEAARRLVEAAHPDGPPLVVDPFAGIGSIPFEALRIGADAFAMDYNPVATLLLKVALEYLPTYGPRLKEAVEKWGKWILDRAREELRPFYPLEPDGSEPLAYLWARTIRCEGPGCGAEVPMVGASLALQKGNKEKRKAMGCSPLHEQQK